MENVQNLPQELVEEILTRLPCKSLIRFKCVCKHWNALFPKDTKFLSRHASHSIKNQNSPATCVLVKIPFLSNMQRYKLISLSATGNIGMETPTPTFKSPSLMSFRNSNGIVCLSSYHGSILLYNPLTTEFRHIPAPPTAEPLECIPRHAEQVGMGYDSFTDDFKIIRIRDRLNSVEQYTLRSDSWTVLHNTNVELFSFDFEGFAMFFKRTFYWWAWYNHANSVIVALNMDDGVFQIVPKPPGACIAKHNARSLTVWNDSISLVCCNYPNPPNIDIWVMDGFDSWILMRTIKHLGEEVPKPLVFWKGNELLIEMSQGMIIKSYNVDTKEVKDLPIKYKHRTMISYLQAVNYEPSLVPLKGQIYHV